MFRQLIAVCAAALCLGTAATTAQTQTQTQNQTQAADTFIWHGELVSVDTPSATFTVKANLLPEAAGEIAKFNPGDRVLVTWSGVDRYAGAIRQVAKYDAGSKVTDPFAFPMELASREVQNGYVTIKFRAPAAAVETVKIVKPGEWVTVTARHRSAGDAQGIVTVEPYVKPASNT
jgi:hypothetical protein